MRIMLFKVRSCDYFLKLDIPEDAGWTIAEHLNGGGGVASV